jgi:hypothetical protein
MTENKQNPGPKSQEDSAPQEETDTQILGPGPRSRTGPNALVHGLYASDIIMPWESKEDFEHLWRELKLEWLPSGRQEFETVLSLAHMNWLKHRLMRTTQVAFRRDPFLSELQKQGVKTWAEVSNFMEQKATEEDTLQAEVMATLKDLKNALQQASKLMNASNPQTLEIYRTIETVHDLYFKGCLPVYQKVFDKVYRKKPNAPDRNQPGVTTSDVYDENPATLIAQAYHPDYLAKLVRLEASIDARIDKILHRLMAMKEYKRIVKETRFVKSPAIAPPDPK